jgi:hypothetical protein
MDWQNLATGHNQIHMITSSNQITPGHNHRYKYKFVHWLLANQIAGGYNQNHMTISANQITAGLNHRCKSKTFHHLLTNQITAYSLEVWECSLCYFIELACVLSTIPLTLGCPSRMPWPRSSQCPGDCCGFQFLGNHFSQQVTLWSPVSQASTLCYEGVEDVWGV